jgi:hypothetical protein
MQLTLPDNQTLVMEHDGLVKQHPKPVVWANERQAIGTVELLPARPDTAAWVAWVGRVGGQWATEADIARM